MRKLLFAYANVVVVVLGFYVPPTAKVILRRDLGSNSQPLVYTASSLTTTPWRLLNHAMRKLLFGYANVVVVVLGFYVPPKAKVILRRDLGSNSQPLVYTASSLTTTPWRLLNHAMRKLLFAYAKTKAQISCTITKWLFLLHR